jgi:hypothetical protein
MTNQEMNDLYNLGSGLSHAAGLRTVFNAGFTMGIEMSGGTPPTDMPEPSTNCVMDTDCFYTRVFSA